MRPTGRRKGEDVIVNGEPRIKILGSIITFEYPEGYPEKMTFRLHQE